MALVLTRDPLADTDGLAIEQLSVVNHQEVPQLTAV
jgi:hypothetical protein